VSNQSLMDFARSRPAGGYQMIMADPPWRFEVYSENGLEKSPEHHYDTMSLDEIKALPVASLAAKDCLLWLWATNPMLPKQLEVIDAWGFQFKTSGVWVKTHKSGKLAFGTGYAFRSASEPIILAAIGSPKTTKSTRSVIYGVRREHSRKPDEAYEAAEALMPDVRRADLFSRESRPGWDNWGNESTKFDEAENETK
jgi:N6-adenosine-specific RNA methylase IME4